VQCNIGSTSISGVTMQIIKSTKLPPVKKDYILADNVIAKLIDIGINYDNRKILDSINRS
jgi:hypothetical protein